MMGYKNATYFFMGSVCLLLMGLYSLVVGRVDINIVNAVSDKIHQVSSVESLVLFELRLPRLLLAILVGAGLGISGAAMQALLRNPLAEPGLLGVSNFAALGAVLVLYFGIISVAIALPLAAIMGSFIALGCVLLLSGIHSSVQTLILAGVAVNAIGGALIAVALNFAPNMFAVQEIVFWLMGSLANRDQSDVMLAAPFILFGICILLLNHRFLDALTLGEETAFSLGFAIAPRRFAVMLGVASCVGACVAVSGSIGFVGLVVPHLVRPIFSHRPGLVLLASALGGAILIVLADTMLRIIPMQQELKLGVVTALLGAPFLFYLVVSARQRWN